MMKKRCMVFYRMIFTAVILILSLSAWGLQESRFTGISRNIDRDVFDIEGINLPGFHEFIFALPGEGGGLAYYYNENELEIYSTSIDMGAESVAVDEVNQRIFVALACNSWSDGLYQFDIESSEFSVIGWHFYPNFVKKLPNGFYFGYGYTNTGGLLFSQNGDVWIEIPAFNGFNITDIEETDEGILFAASESSLFMEIEDSWISFDTDLIINDIFILPVEGYDEVYIAIGNGTDSDAVYRVEYNNNSITGLTMINWFLEPNALFVYDGLLVVGCNNNNGLFLVEPEEMSEPIEIADTLNFSNVYCFNVLPIYTPNFVMGTDTGTYTLTNINVANNEDICPSGLSVSNFPNPFNPTTTIKLYLTESSETELNIYDVKGKLIRNLIHAKIDCGYHDFIWNGKNNSGKNVSSGIYFYRLKTNKNSAAGKMLLLK